MEGRRHRLALFLAILTEKAYGVTTIVACGDDRFFAAVTTIPGG